ncbi:MAG: glutathione S-transferase family protein [Rubrimonas sp.]
MTITVWGRRNSSNVQKVLWALEELGLPFQRVRAGGQFGGLDADYRAMNPNGYVPTIRDGALTLFESDAILRWLARTHGAGRLWRGEAEFALADQWTTWNTATFYPTVAGVFFPTVRTPRAEQKPDALGPAAAALQAQMAVLEGALDGRPWLCGDAFTYGDIGPAVSARRASLLPAGRPQIGPNVAAWLARVAERPAWAAHCDQPIGACLEDWREIEAQVG